MPFNIFVGIKCKNFTCFEKKLINPLTELRLKEKKKLRQVIISVFIAEMWYFNYLHYLYCSDCCLRLRSHIHDVLEHT